MDTHIELVGPPGSGKSTLSTMIRAATGTDHVTVYDDREAYETCVLRAYLPDSAVPVGRRLPPRLIRAASRWSGWRADTQLAFQLNRPQAHERMAELVTAYSTDPNRHDWLTRKALELQAHYQSAQRGLRPDETILFDEGFVHYALSLCCPPDPTDSLSRNDLEAYLESVPLPEACLIVTAPSKLRKRRMDARKKGRPGQYAHLNDDAFDRYLERADRCLDATRSILVDSGVEVVEFETDVGLAETGEAVDRFVDSRLRRR